MQELRALQVEGLNIQWPAELDELTSVESAALAQASWAATQRLQTVMNSQAMLLGNRRWVWYAGVACVAALLIGGGGAGGCVSHFCWMCPELNCRLWKFSGPRNSNFYMLAVKERRRPGKA